MTSADDIRRAPPTTERANPRARDLDVLAVEDMLRVMNDEDRGVPEAVRAVIPAIARAVDAAAASFRAGGRLLYFGAGTSGRLGVLDASECPPTFGVPPESVRGFMAGGDDAVVHAAEGAEDREDLGVADVSRAGVAARDTVVALTASGRTPYALGALREARRRGATTVAITCNRPSPVHAEASIVIDPLVGEEVLSGSTRLKAGTAQKLALNMLSTGAMVRVGRAYGNLMVGVAATNEKLRARAARLTAEIVGRNAGVDAALAACGHDVRVASLMLLKGLDAAAARARLDAAAGSLRAALHG